MPIIYGIAKENLKFPVKMFIHSSGLKEIYQTAENALQYTEKCLKDSLLNLKNLDYIISITWGSLVSKEKIIDVFGFSDISNWPGNPDVNSWVLKNKILIKENPLTCGDSLILLGKEEEIRRKCKNIEEYIRLIPNFE